MVEMDLEHLPLTILIVSIGVAAGLGLLSRDTFESAAGQDDRRMHEVELTPESGVGSEHDSIPLKKANILCIWRFPPG